MLAAFVLLVLLSIRTFLRTSYVVVSSRYEVLSVSESREAYDRHGLDGISGRGGPGGADQAAAEMFAEMFGAGMHFGFDFGQGSGFSFGGPRRRTKGDDSVIPYDVTLEDLYNGKSVKMNMEKEIVCSVCKG